MGFLDWLGRSVGKPPSSHPPAAEGAPFPELVLLMEEPLNPATTFVQGAVEHALGVSLPVGQPNSTEFVTGQFPFFFVQFGGRLLQIKFMPFPYFAPKAAAFITGDPNLVVRRAEELNLKETLTRHRAWIAVSFMNSSNPPGTDDPYYYVGKMLSAFGVGPAVALIWPECGEIREWDRPALDALRSGDPLSVFK